MGRGPVSISSGLKKGPWTADEDLKLKEYIELQGAGNWRTLPENAGLQRCGKSCRLRWTNYLRPDIKRGRFSFEEEEAIIQLHSVLGNKWSAIAARLPGRTDNEIKNYWNTHIRKRLFRMGLDPVTHAPSLDQLSQLSNLSNLLFVQHQQMVNPQLLNTLLSLNQQQQKQILYDGNNNVAEQPQNHFRTYSFLQTNNQPAQGFSTSSSISMDDPNSLVFQEPNYWFNNVGSGLMLPDDTKEAAAATGTSSFGSLKDNQQFSLYSTPFTSRASSPLDSSYTSNGLSTDDEMDSVLNFEIPEGFDLSELLY